MPIRVASVAESFATYRAGVLPAGAPDVQVLECRRAFYAGVYFLLMDGLLNIGDTMSEDEGVARLEAIKVECEAFGALGGLPPPVPPITVPDIHHEAPAALVEEIRPVLERIGHQVGDDLPEGWGFALFLFTLGVGGHTFYIATCDRADVVTALHDFIRRQVS
jgi:hypothetical protein